MAIALLSVGQKRLFLTVPSKGSCWRSLDFCCESVVSPRKENSGITDCARGNEADSLECPSQIYGIPFLLASRFLQLG